MRIRIKAKFVLLLVMTAVSFMGSVATAQRSTTPSTQPRPELALEYTFVHSNAPPGSCTCFNLNGGTANFAWPIKSGGFALAADLSVTHAGSISSNGDDLTLTAFTVGGRYTRRIGHSPLRPFGQVLVGFAHSSGSLVEGRSSSVTNSGAAFTANIGGGVDLRVSHRFSVRIVDANYFVTTFDNGDNNHQNNLRLDSGLVVRL